MQIHRQVSVLVVVATALGSGACWADPSSDDAAIRAALAYITKAYVAKDAKAAMAPYSASVVTFDIMPPLQAVGFERNLETTQTVLDATVGPFTVDYSDINITVDHNHAYGRYIVHVAGKLKDGRQIDMLERTTDVWQKIKGKWLIVHEHNSVPIDMVTGKANMKAPMGGVAVPFEPPNGG